MVKKVKWGRAKSREAWLQMRSAIQGDGQDFVRIGASDVPTIMKAGYSCPARLMYKLVGIHNHTTLTANLVAGNRLENEVGSRFMGFNPHDFDESLHNWDNGIQLRKIKKADFFVLNSDYPWLAVSLDFVPVGKVYSPWTGELYHPLTPIEAKTTRGFIKKEWEDVMPYAHKIQLNTQMLTTNTYVGVHIVLVDGFDFYANEIEKDEDLCNMIVHETKLFSDIVLAGRVAWDIIQSSDDQSEREDAQAYLDAITPEPISDDDIKLYKEINDEDNGLILPATELQETLMYDYLEINKSLKEQAERKDIIQATLLKDLGDFQILKGENFKMTYKRSVEKKGSYFRVAEIK